MTMTNDHLLEDLILEWRDLAACNQHNPDMWFPAGLSGPAAEQIAYAKRVCGGCEVQEDCLSYAIETNQISGIWGGLTEDERRPVRRRWLAERRRQTAS